jgi:hypothetical protein
VADFTVLRVNDDQTLTVIDKKVTDAVDAGDAWNRVLAAGKVNVTDDGSTTYQILSLEGSEKVKLDVQFDKNV